MSALTDELLIGLTNDAIREATNAASDNAWFVRRTVSLTLNSPPATTTMPAEVKRLYRLEREACPGDYIDWTLVRRDDTGALVILPTCGDSVIAHYHAIEDELVDLLDETSFPWQHEELIVAMVLVRLAETQGNDQLLQLLIERKERLLRVFKRDCLYYERMRKDPIKPITSRETWAGSLRRARWL